MKKNGFTLIELLAVIVILAIIALIATPIILGIINDAREKANERSVELYAAAVKNAMAAYQLTSPNAPESFSDLTVQYDGDVKCTVQELYEDGSFYLEGCKVNNGEKEYSYGTKQGSTYEGTMNICNPLNVQTVGTYTAGDKYECDVDPNKEGYDYTFYVLNASATEVNLIMDSNININGNAVKGEETDLGYVAWTSYEYLEEHAPQEDLENYENLNIYGPVTAMNHLQTATSGWTNTNKLTINTFDSYDENENYDDVIYVATHNMTEYIVNARMPYLNEISDYDREEGSNAYLYDNLNLICYSVGSSEEIACSDALDFYKAGVDAEGLEHIRDVYSYWTLSSIASDSFGAWLVHYQGYVNTDNVDFGNDGFNGVRPVINLSI